MDLIEIEQYSELVNKANKGQGFDDIVVAKYNSAGTLLS